MAGLLGIWWSACRPKTLAAGVVPIAVGSALGLGLTGSIAWTVAGCCLLTSVLLQIACNFINDAADGVRGTDAERLGDVRAVAAGLLTPAVMWRGALVVLGLAVASGGYLMWLGGWPVVVLGVMSIAGAIAYTAGPVPLAYRGLGDLFVLIFFGWVAVLGAAWLQVIALLPDSSISGLPWWWLLVATGLGLQATVIIAINNHRDQVGDRHAHKRTLAVRLGNRWHIIYLMCLNAAATACWLTAATIDAGLWPAVAIAVLGGGAVIAAVGRLSGRDLAPWLGRAAAVELATGIAAVIGLAWP